MHCCFESSAIKKLITGQINPVIGLLMNTCIFGVTNDLVNEYESDLDGHEMFYPWMLVAIDAGRLRYLDSHITTRAFPTLTALHDHYLPCSYLSGQRYFLAKNAALNPTDQMSFDEFGIRIYYIENYINDFGSVSIGDNPIEETTLTETSTKEPSVITRYLQKSSSVIVYDKYINNNAIEFMKECCSVMPPGATITILTKQGPCLNPNQIINILRPLYPSLVIDSFIVSRHSNPLPHDRYIFVDNRYQIDFSAGLDSFIKTVNGWQNRRSKISTYDILQSCANLTFDLLPAGSRRTKCYESQ